MSCHYLPWLFAECARRNIEPQRLLRGIPYARDQLEEEHRFISWRTYSEILANASKYLAEHELKEAGE